MHNIGGGRGGGGKKKKKTHARTDEMGAHGVGALILQVWQPFDKSKFFPELLIFPPAPMERGACNLNWRKEAINLVTRYSFKTRPLIFREKQRLLPLPPPPLFQLPDHTPWKNRVYILSNHYRIIIELLW